MNPSYNNKPKEYFGQDREEIMVFVPVVTKTLLEVGCVKGEFVARLKTRAPLHATGIEPHAAAAALAKGHFDLILESSVEDSIAQLQGNSFDCMVFNDVLEHMADPWSVLRMLRPFLAKNGRVVASIPNLRHLPVLRGLVVNGEWEYAEYGVLDKTHLRFFTESTIRKLFADTGYVVETIQGINATVFSWKIRLINRLCGNRFSDCRFQQFACVAHSG